MLKSLITSLLLSSILVLASQTSYAETTSNSSENIEISMKNTSSNHANIIDLLGYIGGRDTPQIMSESLLKQLKQLFTQEPRETWDDVTLLLQKEQVILLNQTIAIFVEEFTPEEVSAMLAFYQSDVGKKMLISLPSVTRKTRQVNQLWSKSVVADIEKMLIQKRAEAAAKEKAQTAIAQ